MTSVLNVDTIADKAGTGPVGLTKQHAAKSFFDLDATGTFSLKDSFNVASATDQATGTFDINYTNAFSSANNVPVNHTLNITSFDNTLTASKTASLVKVKGINSTNGTVQDTDPFGATHGDLA